MDRLNKVLSYSGVFWTLERVAGYLGYPMK